MTFLLERALAARAARKKLVVVGLKSATSSEIAEYKKELKEHNIDFTHKTAGLKFNGVLKIYPTNQRAIFNVQTKNPLRSRRPK